ncbi:MAG: hypothetical protein AB1716_10950 [Planctomycetota bacterium]
MSIRSQRTWGAYLLGVMTVAAAALAWRGLAPRPVYAQVPVPDAGAQRKEMLVELRAANQKLTEMLALLKQIRDQSVPGKVARPIDAPPPPAR